MWPWEHLAVGYVLVSLASHGLAGRAPTDREAWAVLGGSLAPDLLDKPLAWELGLLGTGYGPGHSLLVTGPVAVVVVAVGWWWGRPGPWAAAAGAALVHLPADVLGSCLRGHGCEPTILLWPVAAAPPTGPPPGLIAQTLVFYGPVQERLLEAGPSMYPRSVVLAFGLVVCLWLVDGLPGVAWIARRH